MALWDCLGCGTVYAVGLHACPHCLSTDYVEDGVPKITVAGGPSSALEPEPEPVEAEEPEVAADEPETAPEAPPELPPAKAPKADWVDTAVAAGVPAEHAESMTKPELVETVKELVPDPQPAATPGPDSTPQPSLPASSAPDDKAKA